MDKPEYLVPPDKLVLTLDEVEKLTGFSEHSIRRGCAAGIYRHTYFGKKYGMTWEHVALLIAAVERGESLAPARASAADDDLEAARQATAAQYTRRGAA